MEAASVASGVVSVARGDRSAAGEEEAYPLRSYPLTAPVAVVNFMNYEGWEWGKIAAGGTLVMLPVLVFSFLVRNFLVRGLTAGAVKG